MNMNNMNMNMNNMNNQMMMNFLMQMQMNPQMMAMMNNPQLMSMMNNPQMMAMMNNPQLMAMMNNPQMMAMMNNPQMMAMMNNPQMMAMMNNPVGGGNISIDDKEGWNLIFEKKSGGPTINLTISPEKTVAEAVSAYKIKTMEGGQMKFIFNGKELPYSLKICQSGLCNGSKILVISTKDVEGAKF